KNVTINRAMMDDGNPINIGRIPKGCPKTCHVIAVPSPIHIDVSPAIFGTLFHYIPNMTGANKPDTTIAVPVFKRCTKHCINKDNTNDTKHTIKTEMLLKNNT